MDDREIYYIRRGAGYVVKDLSFFCFNKEAVDATCSQITIVMNHVATEQGVDLDMIRHMLFEGV